MVRYVIQIKRRNMWQPEAYFRVNRKIGQKAAQGGGGRHVVAGAHAFCHRVLVAYDAEEINTSCISFGAACDRQYTTDATDGESDGEGILLQRTVCTRLSGSPEGLQRQKATAGVSVGVSISMHVVSHFHAYRDTREGSSTDAMNPTQLIGLLNVK